MQKRRFSHYSLRSVNVLFSLKTFVKGEKNRRLCQLEEKRHLNKSWRKPIRKDAVNATLLAGF